MPPKILIVEDEPFVLEGYRAKLAFAGAFEVVTAETLEDAVRVYGEQAPFDAIAVDLQLLAEGHISFEEPFEYTTVPVDLRGPALHVKIGDRATVPRSRMVRAMFPPAVRESRAGGPYRERAMVELVNRRSERRTIRPGGTMTVFTFDSESPQARLKVRYRANPEYYGEQCESGAWFYLPEQDFLRMGEEARRIEELERLERAIVVSMLGSF